MKKLLRVLIALVLVVMSISMTKESWAASEAIEVETFEAFEAAIKQAPTDNSVTKIIILNNIDITDTLTVAASQNIQVSVHENSMVYLSASPKIAVEKSIFAIESGGQLSLGNKNESGNFLVINVSETCSGPIIKNEGSFYLNDAMLTGATGELETTTGGGVYNAGYFEMNGGELSNKCWRS